MPTKACSTDAGVRAWTAAQSGVRIESRHIQSLRAELESAGVYRHHEAASWAKLVLLLTISGALLAGVVILPWAWSLLLVPAAAVSTATAAMIGHEGAHRSFSSSPWRNELMLHLTFPLLAGLGATYWKHKHNRLHHGHPNVVGGDPDIDIWPMASCLGDHEQSGAARRWFQRNLQGVAFWPLTTLMPTVMRIPSVTHLVRAAREGRVGAAWLADATCLIAHYGLWLVVPAILWGVVPALLLYAALWGLVGVLLGLVFAPAHMGLPVVTDQHNDWLHQLETTRNLRMPRWLSWFFVGLDYQIEHHLLPRIPHQNMPRASVIVAAWCARTGVPYQQIGYGEAVASVTRFVAGAWAAPAAPGRAAMIDATSV